MVHDRTFYWTWIKCNPGDIQRGTIIEHNNSHHFQTFISILWRISRTLAQSTRVEWTVYLDQETFQCLNKINLNNELFIVRKEYSEGKLN